MVAVPADTAVINPVDALIVAAALSLDHTPPALPLELNVVVPLTQIESAPLTVPALGAAVTTTDLLAVSFAHPPMPYTTYLIVVVPAATGVTSPV